MTKYFALRTLSVWIPFGIFVILFIGIKWNGFSSHHNDVTNTFKIGDKQKGAHVFGRLDSNSLIQLKKYNLEWITLVPYAGQEDYNSSSVSYRKKSRGGFDRDSIWQSQINLAHQFGFKVFLKPHIWMHDPSEGLWRSDIFPDNDQDWDLWKTSYTTFILDHAKIAERTNTEMFCIGAEFTKLTLKKPEYFRTLIKEVRKVYSGKLTYAANWYQEYEQVSFWKDLDYIGIQAYFPLVDKSNPSSEEISSGWVKYLVKLEALSKKYDRKVLFTELGYKSTAESAQEPWHWIDHGDTENENLSYDTQANAYRAFFETVWKQNWFAGVHIWQLRCDNRGRSNPKTKFDFTPRGKPAEKVIVKGFK